MIAYINRLGQINVTNAYFAKIIGKAVSSCYGVAGMIPSKKQKLLRIFDRKDAIDNGIEVRGDIDNIVVELRIVVVYGMNINAIAKSIINKIKYTVFDATGITVDKVIVKVAGIKE